MILINLLPHRELQRKRRKEAFQGGIFISVLMGMIISGLIYFVIQLLIDEQVKRNNFLKSEISVLEKQISEIKNIEEEIAALRGRQRAVEDLQANRNVPVQLLSELVNLLPDGVYLKEIKQKGQNVELRGVAQSNERVSEVLRNISSIERFGKPELKEIVADVVSLAPKDQRKVVNFILNFKLLLPSDMNQEVKK